MFHTLIRRSVLIFMVGTAIIQPRVVAADLSPEWIATLPLGSSLSAGIQGLVVDGAGASYVTGTTGSSSNSDVITSAFEPDGSLRWTRTYNGTANWHDQARGIALAPGGVVYVTGNTPDSQSYANVLLLKYDTVSGVLLNTVQYSSASFTSEYGGSVAVDAQGNVYVAGGTVGDSTDALILKFNAAGQLQWTRVWDGPAFAPYSQDSAQQLRLTSLGEPLVLIHGVMGSNHPDYVIVKYAPTNGATMWQAIWGVNGGDFATDMEVDAADDIYVTGTGIDFIDKFSTIKLRGNDGSLVWQFYDSAGVDNSSRALALDASGGVYVTGSADPDGDHSNFNDNFYTVKRDAGTGSLLWSHLYGQNCVGCYDVPSDVVVDPAGNVFVAGNTSSPPYTSDVLTLVLDTVTGLENTRGVVASGPGLSAGSGFLRFDAAYNLFNGGRTSNSSTGQVELSIFKYASLAGPSAPTAYCTAGTSSHGCVPTIAATGTPSVSATSGFTISVATVEGQKQGLIFYGVSGRNAVPWAAGSNSLLCVKTPTQRTHVQSTGGNLAACDGVLSQDWAAWVAAQPGSLGTPFRAGDIVNAQAWYRDPTAAKTTNLSNALEFLLQP